MKKKYLIISSIILICQSILLGVFLGAHVISENTTSDIFLGIFLAIIANYMVLWILTRKTQRRLRTETWKMTPKQVDEAKMYMKSHIDISNTRTGYSGFLFHSFWWKLLLISPNIIFALVTCICVGT